MSNTIQQGVWIFPGWIHRLKSGLKNAFINPNSSKRICFPSFWAFRLPRKQNKGSYKHGLGCGWEFSFAPSYLPLSPALEPVVQMSADTWTPSDRCWCPLASWSFLGFWGALWDAVPVTSLQLFQNSFSAKVMVLSLHIRISHSQAVPQKN